MEKISKSSHVYHFLTFSHHMSIKIIYCTPMKVRTNTMSHFQVVWNHTILTCKDSASFAKNRSKQPGLSNCALKLSYLKITHMSYTLKQIETPIIFLYKVEKCETTPGHHYGQHQGTIRQHQGTETTPGHQVRQHQGIM